MGNEVPIAYCPFCEERRIVMAEEIRGAMVVYCPHCDRIMSNDREVKLEWYEEEDLIE